MKNFYTYLGEVEKLPLRVEDEPNPLIWIPFFIKSLIWKSLYDYLI
jgi:hypothetical protein